MDVMFEDGSIRTSVYYKEFKNGRIRVNYKVKRLGERRMMNCGMTAEIIRYRNTKDVDIQFENGCIREHVSYHHFEKGRVQSEKVLTTSRIGECRKMNCGMEAKIIRYQNNHDIDVKFTNGEIRTGVSYSNFRKGEILPIPQCRSDRVGEHRMMECGVEAEVIEYRSCRDMTVRFTDGSIRTGVSYYKFQRGKVSPKFRSNKDIIDATN